jgi:hypothetical protein
MEPDIWIGHSGHPLPPLRITIPSLRPLFPWSNNDRDELSRQITNPSIMSLFTLILEALAGTVTLLSAPKLLDRVLTHLCTLPFLSL